MIFINPGSGRVDGATEDNARAALAVLIADTHLDGVTVGARVTDGGDGRWSFRLRLGDRTCDVEMPGLPIERVRYTGEKGQNIWHFPRLYVDGSSWVWEFAVPCVRAALTGEEE